MSSDDHSDNDERLQTAAVNVAKPWVRPAIVVQDMADTRSGGTNSNNLDGGSCAS